MKKLLVLVIVIAGFQSSRGQDFNKVKNSVIIPGQLENAKTEIDKVMNDPKAQSKAEGWIWKAKVYSAIYADEKLRAKYPGSETAANAAFQKYAELDPSYKILKDNNLQTFAGDMYGTSFGQGVRTYNTKVWDSAAYYFKYAVKYSDLIFKNKWGRDTTMQYDTTSILYAGVSSEKAKDKDTAALYYGRIAGYKLSKIGGSDISDIYRWLVDYYYNQQKDNASTVKYLRLGKAVFPEDLLWPDTELDMARKSGNKDTLFARYEEITAEYPKSNVFFYNYGVELYNYAIDTSSGKRPANADALIEKAKEKLNKSLELNPEYAQAALLLGQITYNQAVDLKATTKDVKGQKPEDIKKRADIRVAAGKKFDEAIPYFEKVENLLGTQGKLKMDAKTTLKDAYDLLITIYEQKNLKDKVDAYTAKFNNVDKDH